MELQGQVQAGFEGVRDAFVQNFEAGLEVGAACSVYHKGHEVVSLAGGVKQRGGSVPYGLDTLQLVFSTSKGVTAVPVNMLVERGQIDLDAPVSEYWPEFAQAGKEKIPVRWLLDHRAGLIDVDAKLELDQVLAWDPVVEALAAQAPLWEPGTAHGYHAITYGWLAGELVRRVSGKSLGRFLADEVAGPLNLDLHIGLSKSQHHRVASLVPLEGDGKQGSQGFASFSMLARALTAPSQAIAGEVYWDPALWAAEVPAVNAICTARGIAKMYAACIGEVDSFRLLSEQTVRDLAVSQNEGADKCLMFETRFSRGFMLLNALSRRFSDSAFGHYGAGGSLGFADPAYELSVAYVMNRMDAGLVGDRRTVNLIRAINRAVGRVKPAQ